MNSLIFPPYVHEGDRAIILSPSSKIDKSFLKGAKKRLKSWGLEVIIAKHAGSAHGTYAGSIQQRLKDLQEAMDDEKAKVILCSRGGYGAVHLVGQLDFPVSPASQMAYRLQRHHRPAQRVSAKRLRFAARSHGTASHRGAGR